MPSDWCMCCCSFFALLTATGEGEEEKEDKGVTASVRSPTPPAEEEKKPVVSRSAFSVTQWSAMSLQWRAVLNILLEELETAATHVIESELAREFVYQVEEKARQASRMADDLATPTASFNADTLAQSQATPTSTGAESGQFKPIQVCCV